MKNNYIMPFGKYGGDYLCNLPTSYLEWIVENIKNCQLKDEAIKELSYRTKGNQKESKEDSEKSMIELKSWAVDHIDFKVIIDKDGVLFEQVDNKEV